MRIGIDIVDINRISTLIEKYNSKFLNRIFSPRELKEWNSRGKRISFLAGRFAAKEAFLKAMQKGGISLKDIEILGIIPSIELNNAKPKRITTEVSISHTDELATSIVIIK